MQVLTPKQRVQRLAAVAWQVAAKVERANAAAMRFHSSKRATQRIPFRAELQIVSPALPAGEVPVADDPRLQTAWCVDLSQGGVGFVSNEQFSGPTIQVGIPLADGGVKWVMGVIRRMVEVPDDDFYEYGVALKR